MLKNPDLAPLALTKQASDLMTLGESQSAVVRFLKLGPLRGGPHVEGFLKYCSGGFLENQHLESHVQDVAIDKVKPEVSPFNWERVMSCSECVKENCRGALWVLLEMNDPFNWLVF